MAVGLAHGGARAQAVARMGICGLFMMLACGGGTQTPGNKKTGDGKRADEKRSVVRLFSTPTGINTSLRRLFAFLAGLRAQIGRKRRQRAISLIGNANAHRLLDLDSHSTRQIEAVRSDPRKRQLAR